MSVLIKDMEKPEFCYVIIDGKFEYCPFVNTDDDCILLLKKGICERTWKGQYSKCPLIEASELCEDAVSRNTLKGYFAKRQMDADIMKEVFDAIDLMPPVTPKRKPGKWIPHGEKCREYIGTVLDGKGKDKWKRSREKRRERLKTQDIT